MIKKLAGSIREYKLVSLLTPFFIVFEVFLEVLIPTYTANIINIIEGNQPGGMRGVLIQGGYLVLMALLSLLFGALSGICGSIASCGFAKNLRHDMYQRIQGFSFANIDHFSTAGLVTRLTTDITYVQNSYQMILRIAVRCPIMLISALVMTIKLEPRISLIFAAVLPLMGVGLFLIIRKAFPIFTRVFKLYDKLSLTVQENLRGMRVVKSFVRGEYEKEKFSAISQKCYEDFTAAERILAFNGPLMQLCVYTCMILVSWFATKFIVAGDIEIGSITALMTYIMQMLMSTMMLSMVFVMITMAKSPAERISEVLSEESDIVSPENAVTEVKDGSIEFRDVCFSYASAPDKLCLNDVDLKISSGQTIGIIGGTGSAKSTLVQLIPRLYDATKGQILVGGVDVRDYDLNTLRDSVAMVLQKNELFSGTIKDNLRWGNENATDEEIFHACRLAQADGFISSFPDGYDTYIEQGGTNVSGGQKQRLCIARALLKKPKILILDDSTSAVDTATDALIRKGFAEYIPQTTKLIIAQRIASVQEADKIIVLDGGRIVSFGSHEELLASSDIYREVYTSQQKGGDCDE